MSRASEWHNIVNTLRPKDLNLWDSGRTHFWGSLRAAQLDSVTGGVILLFGRYGEQETKKELRPGEAALLGKWLVENFSE